MAELLLQQFAREPVPGQVKTRMQPALTPQAACDLHCELVRWTCSQLLQSGLGDVEICVAGDPGHGVFQDCLHAGAIRVVEQRGKDLGERMYHALRRGLRDHPAVILVGSDCPAISPAYLLRAAQSLMRAEVVIAPAEDGGYVLVGATTVTHAMFEGIAWGSDRVFEQTMARIAQVSLACEVLPVLPDIDRPEDLLLWHALRDNRV